MYNFELYSRFGGLLEMMEKGKRTLLIWIDAKLVRNNKKKWYLETIWETEGRRRTETLTDDGLEWR